MKNFITYITRNVFYIEQVKERRDGLGHVTRMGEENCTYRILEEEHKGRIPLGRSKYRWRVIVKCILEK